MYNPVFPAIITAQILSNDDHSGNTGVNSSVKTIIIVTLNRYQEGLRGVKGPLT